MIRSILTIAAFSVAVPIYAGTIADLTADWSSTANPNNSNPNGTWQYNQGFTNLPLVSDWQSLCGGSPAQPAWAPSNSAGDFLPALMQAQCTPSAAGISSANFAPGDIVMHTVDGFNGNPGAGDGDYLFISAVSAVSVEISGSVWDAREIGRPQGWNLIVNGLIKASGSLSTGDVPRASAQTFDLTGLSIAPGSTVELELFNTGGVGDFVGSTLTITGDITTPEPSGIVVVAAGVLVLALVRRRRQGS